MFIGELIWLDKFEQYQRIVQEKCIGNAYGIFLVVKVAVFSCILIDKREKSSQIGSFFIYYPFLFHGNYQVNGVLVYYYSYRFVLVHVLHGESGGFEHFYCSLIGRSLRSIFTRPGFSGKMKFCIFM